MGFRQCRVRHPVSACLLQRYLLKHAHPTPTQVMKPGPSHVFRTRVYLAGSMADFFGSKKLCKLHALWKRILDQKKCCRFCKQELLCNQHAVITHSACLLIHLEISFVTQGQVLRVLVAREYLAISKALSQGGSAFVYTLGIHLPVTSGAGVSDKGVPCNQHGVCARRRPVRIYSWA